jgi:hypothetical protein
LDNMLGDPGMFVVVYAKIAERRSE